MLISRSGVLLVIFKGGLSVNFNRTTKGIQRLGSGVVSRFSTHAMIYTLILSLITSQLALPLQAIAAGEVSIGNDPPEGAVTKAMVPLIDAYDAGKTIPHSDPFLLSSQYVELLGKNGEVLRTIQFGEAQNWEGIPYNSVQTAYDAKSHEIVFSGSFGQVETIDKKEVFVGVTKLRHRIPLTSETPAIESFSFDKEVLILVDRSHGLHAMDMGYVSTQLGKGALPVYRKRWSPPEKESAVNSNNIKIELLTQGVKPYQDVDLLPGAVLPKDALGNPKFRAGDVMVSSVSGDGAHKKVLGVFDRELLIATMVKDNEFLMLLSQLADPDRSSMEHLASRLEKASMHLERVGAQISLDRPLRAALSSIGSEALRTLKDRSKDLTSSAGEPKDWFYLSDWIKAYETIIGNPPEKTGHGSEAVMTEKWSSLLHEGSKQSGQGSTPEAQLKSGRKTFRAAIAKLTKAISENKDYVIGMGVFSTYIVGSVAFPFAYQRIEALQQISLVSHLYEAVVVPVMRDFHYAAINTYSVLSATLMIPALWAGSFILGSRMKAMSEFFKQPKYQGKLWAVKLSETCANWGKLTPWQLIMTMGIRLLSMLVVAPRALVTVTGQVEFLKTIDAKLNPFTWVSESRARVLGVPEFKGGLLGVRARYTYKPNETYEKLRAKILAEKRDARALANELMLAVTVASEKEGVDVGTLLQAIQENQTTPGGLKKFLETKEARREWRLIHARLASDLAQFAEEIQKPVHELRLDMNNLEVSYQFALHAAKRVRNALSPQDLSQLQGEGAKIQRASFLSRHQLKLLSMDASLQTVALLQDIPRRIANLGKSTSRVLSQIFPNKFVTSAITSEFPPDHLAVVGLTATVGGRADPGLPEKLAAIDNPGSLWTAMQHLQDYMNNMFMHLVMQSGLTIMVHQILKPAKETRYARFEDEAIHSHPRVDHFLRGMYSYVRGVLDPKRSDLGRIWVTKYLKRIDAIFGMMALSVSSRLLIATDWEQTQFLSAFAQAFGGWALFFVAGNWVYGFWWDLLQQGTKNYQNDFEKMNTSLKHARALLSDVGRLKDFDEKKSALTHAERILTQLYPEPTSDGVSQRLRGLFYWGGKKQNEASTLVHHMALTSDQISSHTADAQALLEQRAKDLLLIATEMPPIATKELAYVILIGTTIAAFATTYMAIGLGIDSFDSEATSFKNISLEALKSVGLFTLFYYTLRREAGLFYYRVYDRIKVALKLKKAPVLCTTALDQPA